MIGLAFFDDAVSDVLKEALWFLD